MAKRGRTKHLEKLEQLLERIKRGEIVQNRDLRTWLGEEAYAAYEAEWAEQIQIRAMLNDKPADIIEYETLLRKAQIFENRAGAESARGRAQASQTLMAKAQTGYELALEFLTEATSCDPSLSSWLDRRVEWEGENAPTLCAEDMPRAITSRRDGVSKGGWLSALKTKRELKAEILIRVLQD